MAESPAKTVANFKTYVTNSQTAAATFSRQGDAAAAAFFQGAAYGAALTVAYLTDELGNTAEHNEYFAMAMALVDATVGLGKMEQALRDI